MGGRAALVVLALLAGGFSVASASDAAQAPSASPAAPPSAADVDRAVDRAVAWLRGEGRGDGDFGGPGETGLALLALRHAGVPADDRLCVAAAKRLAADLPSGSTYGDAFGVLGLLAQDPKLHRATIESCVARLVASQCGNGQWTYVARGKSRAELGDNSYTQCASLALAAAAARGFAVPRETAERLLAMTLRTRNADGGHGYGERQDTKSYGSMTAGAAMHVALARSLLDGKPIPRADLASDDAVRPSIEWLARSFHPWDHPGRKDAGDWRLYWLWSAERAGAVLDVAKYGDRDWYAEGAAALLAAQRTGGSSDGSWCSQRALADTCFAVLFLRRATRSIVAPVTTSGRGAGATTPSSADAPRPEPSSPASSSSPAPPPNPAR